MYQIGGLTQGVTSLWIIYKSGEWPGFIEIAGNTENTCPFRSDPVIRSVPVKLSTAQGLFCSVMFYIYCLYMHT